ncbi:carbohydrate kinase [Egicoccus sp. AB-alg2]|uniref:carbohydrate kinase family protein n=1 Tax=Egicoccus sp. AB-alg2 TaxID=3242693 RepID=UPI00359D2A37
MIVVVGEALVDLAPARGDDPDVLRPLLGGSPYNVAVGLGRLGTDTAYLGGLSRDAFGRKLAQRLEDEHVSLHLVHRTDAPTTLAVVHLDDQARASYGFYLNGTSAAELSADHLDGWQRADAVHVSLGAVTLETDPAGAALVGLLTGERDDTLLSLDPNVRPSVIGDLGRYAARLDEVVRHTDLVKVSDEDLAVLHPDRGHGEVARRWAQAGPAAVVVTRGPDGAEVHLASGEVVEVPGEAVEVADTVGAGDAFTSGLLYALDRAGTLSRHRIRDLDVAGWRAALQVAVRVAAITCTRVGADPPHADELQA